MAVLWTILSLDGGRIDPADMTIGAAINQIDATVSSVTKHDHRSTGQIELHDSIAYRHAFQRRRRFGDDDGIELGDLFVGILVRRRDDIAWRRQRI